MQFAVGVPNVGLFGDPELLVALAGEAEAAGWDGMFVWDHLLYDEPDWPVADPLVVASAIAASTTRIRLGVLVLAMPRRQPWLLAKQLSTLDVLSKGRLIVGAGLGALTAEYSGFGDTADRKLHGERLDEALEVLTGLWSGKPFRYAGRHYRVDDAVMLPRPVQRPRPPIWCGGRWPARAPFRRGARYDGIMPTHQSYELGQTMPPGSLAEIVAYVRAHRTGDDLFDVVVEGRTDDAEMSVVDDYAAVGCTWWIEALGWWRGSVDDAFARVRTGPRISQ